MRHITAVTSAKIVKNGFLFNMCLSMVSKKKERPM